MRESLDSLKFLDAKIVKDRLLKRYNKSLVRKVKTQRHLSITFIMIHPGLDL